ncbi:MAG: isocitrate lyase/PEP mutase family protein [Rhodospirillales bacterium]|nr:MAG: isocitrate lyase/PEP mutase family protein [Rhodospirillales bacterium]
MAAEARAPSFNDRRRALRALVSAPGATPAMGATDALSARLIEAAGFGCVYIGSYATAASRFGLADTGLLTLDDMVAQARTIVDATTLPVVADAEGGFNDAANIWRTVRAFERAGVAAIHIEDHAFGKHADVPQRLHTATAVAGRIRAAVDAREDPDMLIVARSDAAWATGDIDETVRRLALYADAGADMVFPTMVPPPALKAIRNRLTRPVMVVDSPGFTLADETAAGADIVLYYGFAALIHYDALTRALARFKSVGDAGAVPGARDRTAEFEESLGYAAFAGRARKYGAEEE